MRVPWMCGRPFSQCVHDCAPETSMRLLRACHRTPLSLASASPRGKRFTSAARPYQLHVCTCTSPSWSTPMLLEWVACPEIGITNSERFPACVFAVSCVLSRWSRLHVCSQRHLIGILCLTSLYFLTKSVLVSARIHVCYTS